MTAEQDRLINHWREQVNSAELFARRTQEDAERDRRDMRRFQELYIGADEALRRIAEQQPRVLGYIRREGFIFDGNLVDYEGWKKLAFSLYSELCEVDAIARSAINGGDVPAPVDPGDSSDDRFAAQARVEAHRLDHGGDAYLERLDRAGRLVDVEGDPVPDPPQPMTVAEEKAALFAQVVAERDDLAALFLAEQQGRKRAETRASDIAALADKQMAERDRLKEKLTRHHAVGTPAVTALDWGKQCSICTEVSS